MSKKSGNILVIVLSVLLFVSVSVTIYFYGQNQQRSKTPPPPVIADGLCLLRDENTSMPSANDPNVGIGYAKMLKKGVNTLSNLEKSCTEKDIVNLTQMYCAENKKRFQIQIALVNKYGGVETNSCPFGCGQISCPASAPSSKTITVEANSLNSDLILTSLLGNEELKSGEEYSVNWKFGDRILHWSDDINICLMGYKNDLIVPAKPEWNEEVCTYRDGNTTGSYLISTDKIINKNYQWTIPIDIASRFKSKPENYKIRIIVLHDSRKTPSSTGWEGNVGHSESGGRLVIK